MTLLPSWLNNILFSGVLLRNWKKTVHNHTTGKQGPAFSSFCFHKMFVAFQRLHSPLLSAIRLTSLLPIIPNRLLLHPTVWNHGCVTPLVRENDSSLALKVSTPILTWQQLTAALWLPAAGDWLWLAVRHSERPTQIYKTSVLLSYLHPNHALT